MKCEHEQFQTDANVIRLTDEAGVVERYAVEFRVFCAQCGRPFVFIGAPHGWSVNGPSMSVDAMELRTQIEPGPVGDVS
jgi:hypothetical protein